MHSRDAKLGYKTRLKLCMHVKRFGVSIQILLSTQELAYNSIVDGNYSFVLVKGRLTYVPFSIIPFHSFCFAL